LILGDFEDLAINGKEGGFLEKKMQGPEWL
jgi:hypothetical protein